jgi:F-type H+-transporting ATPase subunit b
MARLNAKQITAKLAVLSEWTKSGGVIQRTFAFADFVQAMRFVDKVAAEAERDRIKAALADSDAEAARIVEEARQAADRIGTDVAARAQVDAQTVRDRAVTDQASTQAQAQADLTAELSRLALGAAERVVESSLDDAAQQRLIDDYISQVGTQN